MGQFRYISQPIKVYWVNYATDKSKESLNFIQRRYAYGLDFKTKTITVKDGANGATKQFKTENAEDMKAFFGALALIGTHTVYPAKFAPCPHHGGEDETIAFALPIVEYNRLAAAAKLNKGDFNSDGTPDSAYISPKNTQIGIVHIEPSE